MITKCISVKIHGKNIDLVEKRKNKYFLRGEEVKFDCIGSKLRYQSLPDGGLYGINTENDEEHLVAKVGEREECTSPIELITKGVNYFCDLFPSIRAADGFTAIVSKIEASDGVVSSNDFVLSKIVYHIEFLFGKITPIK